MEKWLQIPPNWPAPAAAHWTRRPSWTAPPLYLTYADDPPRWIDPLTSSVIPMQDITRFKTAIPAAQPFEIEVTGTLSPDFTGTYTRRGILNTGWYFQRAQDSCFIFWFPPFSAWAMATLALPTPSDFWTTFGQADPTLLANTYTPQGTYTGDATVTT